MNYFATRVKRENEGYRYEPRCNPYYNQVKGNPKIGFSTAETTCIPTLQCYFQLKEDPWYKIVVYMAFMIKVQTKKKL